MTNVSRDRKKSNFTQQSIIPAGATFDFVHNGTNIKISVEDMITAFGSGGTLEQKGDVTQTPILNKNGAINEIRNLEDGSGVKASISPNGGAQLDHNFSIGTTGVPVLGNPTASSPVIRNLIAGTGVTIAISGDSLQIAASGLVTASNVVIVNEMADFPTAVSGVITLSDDTAYLVSAQLTTANRFVYGQNSVIYGPDSTVSSLTYTGVDTMFTSTSENAKLFSITVDCPNGQLLDISSTSGGGIWQMLGITVVSCDTIGTLGDIMASQFTSVGFYDVKSGGLVFTGTIGFFIGDRGLYHLNGGTLFDLGTATFTFGWSLISGLVIGAAGTTFITGLVDSGNIPVGSLGTIFNFRVSTLGAILNNIATNDSRWEFAGNNNIQESRTTLLATHGGATITIGAINTPVIIGTTWTEQEASRFTTTAGGRFTYTGVGGSITLHATITADIALATHDCTFYFAKNGAVISDSGITREMSAGNAGNLSLLWGEEDIQTGDFIELFCENNGAVVNIIIVSAIFRVD